jgi:hypothetical protein
VILISKLLSFLTNSSSSSYLSPEKSADKKLSVSIKKMNFEEIESFRIMHRQMSILMSPASSHRLSKPSHFHSVNLKNVNLKIENTGF